jgi:hypothetical protein
MKRIAACALLGLALTLAGCAFLLNTPPTAMISATPEQGSAPLMVSLSAAGSYDDGGITAYRWDFGDGWGATGATCQHTYTHPGTYTARLTVEDEFGETDTASISIVVYGLAAYNRSFAWASHGETWTWDIAIPQSLHTYYVNQVPRYRCSDTGYCDWYIYVTDADDDAFIETLSENLLAAITPYYADSLSAYHGFLQFALDFVTAAIPYTIDSLPNEWPRYPLETLVEVVGDCEDTGILYCSIVRPHAVSTHLLFFPTHVASAVPVDWGFIDSRDYSVGYYEYQGNYYVIAETTGDPPGYWRVGELPDSLRVEWTSGGFWFYDVGLRASLQGKGLVHEPTNGL